MQQESGLRDFYFQVILHLRGMWRHRWQMVFTAWFVCIAGWGAVAVMEDQYVARAQVQIDDPRENISQFLDKDSIALDVTREAKRILNRLMERDNLLKVIRETDLAFRVSNDAEKEETLRELRAQLMVKQTANNIYQISHRHADARLTQQVVEVLLSSLPLDNVKEYREDNARTAEEFLGRQVSDFEQKVIEAERQLREFKAKNMLVLPGKDGGYYERMHAMMQKVEEDEGTLKELEKREEEMLRQLADMSSNNSSPTADVDNRIAELNTQLNELFDKYYMKNGVKMRLYTENHSEVMSLRKSIELLQQQKEDMTERLRQEAENPDRWELESNPIYRRLKTSISELEVEKASVQSRLLETKQKLSKLKEMENSLPSIENEMLRLQSYLDMAKKKMLTMLDKEDSARFTGDIAEGLSRYVHFKVLERPSVPDRPVGPDRLLFSSVVLAGGLSAGLALGLFLTVIRPVFDSPASLRKVLGLPVLGMVSMVDEGVSNRWKSSNSFFFFVLICIFVCFFAVLYVGGKL
ncbi:MAG: hypothetical protein HQL84_18345 [Magnetococcales bacterium]|nr:hypothetical protein [Magnetococcales bacterium]MBF0151980.1 hypothetical protein [Magnetococcales bacterium]MBF0172594.1 hypothetical protein [Magnetococcales bacterium]MBF0348959.1 hypothetical protein [Magnetococcales bacterium]MBF0630237.1 hypothetical protein [Magnetococcales bacterium]